MVEATTGGGENHLLHAFINKLLNVSIKIYRNWRCIDRDYSRVMHRWTPISVVTITKLVTRSIALGNQRPSSYVRSVELVHRQEVHTMQNQRMVRVNVVGATREHVQNPIKEQ